MSSKATTRRHSSTRHSSSSYEPSSDESYDRRRHRRSYDHDRHASRDNRPRHRPSSRDRDRQSRHRPSSRDYDRYSPVDKQSRRSYDNDKKLESSKSLKSDIRVVQSSTPIPAKKPNNRKKTGFWQAVKMVKEGIGNNTANTSNTQSIAVKEGIGNNTANSSNTQSIAPSPSNATLKPANTETDVCNEMNRLRDDVKLYRDKYHAEVEKNKLGNKANNSRQIDARIFVEAFKLFNDFSEITNSLIEDLPDQAKRQIIDATEKMKKWIPVENGRAFLKSELSDFANRKIDKLNVYDYLSGGKIVYAVNKMGFDFEKDGKKIEILEMEGGVFVSLKGRKLEGPEVWKNGELKFAE